jgi:hypothetical protein
MKSNRSTGTVRDVLAKFVIELVVGEPIIERRSNLANGI